MFGLILGILIVCLCCACFTSRAQAEEVFTGQADTDGIHMRYLRFGSGDRTVAVLPGLTPGRVADSADAVAQALKPLAADATVYLFDVREDLPEGITLPEIAEGTARVIGSLDLKEICLYGTSMGGMLSLYLASVYPELVRALAVTASACECNDTIRTVFPRWSALARAGRGAELVKDMAEHVYSENTISACGASLFAGGELLSRAELDRIAVQSDAILRIDLADRVPLIRSPILVQGSRGDRVLSGAASERIAELAGVNALMYGPEYGHAVYDEARETIDRVAEFFAQFS